ncbi:NAD(P)H-dependent oxidoreductase [Pseudoalteromonas sp. 2CM32C]|uniref:NAD(P)H-dependent oxidoreductase n=1 Tax=Pseudoalteromonas sp. 2CM32C TaxID=2929852 RepID=UPI0020C03A0C|nr:NAD(P)H-dependent oxidoreductase [Pseudoalteromonas sp. 2CM32C]MCK8120196.1 NAD(P)H-dependent oxidoreductase [Pseudoalteromonas sp. 2CM32C]
MKKVLINFAHPAKSRSNVNKALRKAIEGIESVTVNDLYAHYPDFMIDVEREQSLCESHDIIVFQHPFYWYSTPAIIKEWFDLVLEHGWAYGSSGKALEGKIIFQAISTGGDSATYQSSGYNQFTLRELTTPFQATAKLCGLEWLPPLAVTGVHRGLESEKMQQHADNYRQVILALRDGLIDIHEAKQFDLLNSFLNQLTKE